MTDQSTQLRQELVLPVSPDMSRTQFVSRFGALYEHSPWIAERAWKLGLDASHATVEGLLRTFREVVEAASSDDQLALIQAHPDLAGRAAVAGTLTSDSTVEQASAGLDQCSAAELARFTELNDAYKDKFQFPFVMAVRHSNRHEILAGRRWRELRVAWRCSL